MFNSEKPSLEDLPTSSQLWRSTILALVGATVILVTVVLPAEYGIDPTGVGRILGLTEMGEIKHDLADEAKRDHSSAPHNPTSIDLLATIGNFFVEPASAQTDQEWRDEISFALEPGSSQEVKLTMAKDDIAEYQMIVDGGRINFDLHAHGEGQSVTYDKQRGSSGSTGEIVAAFPGNHGWFWRNRDKSTVTITLRLRGVYSELKRDN